MVRTSILARTSIARRSAECSPCSKAIEARRDRLDEPADNEPARGRCLESSSLHGGDDRGGNLLWELRSGALADVGLPQSTLKIGSDWPGCDERHTNSIRL